MDALRKQVIDEYNKGLSCRDVSFRSGVPIHTVKFWVGANGSINTEREGEFSYG